MVNQFYKWFFKQNNNWWQQSIPKLFFHISVLFLNVIKENKKTPSNKKLVWTDVSLLGYNKTIYSENSWYLYIRSLKFHLLILFKQITHNNSPFPTPFFSQQCLFSTRVKWEKGVTFSTRNLFVYTLLKVTAK